MDRVSFGSRNRTKYSDWNVDLGTRFGKIMATMNAYNQSQWGPMLSGPFSFEMSSFEKRKSLERHEGD